jgi:hypothetical protein
MDLLPIEVSRKTFVLATATIAVALVVLSAVTLDLFLADFRSRQRDLLLDEIQEVRAQAVRTAGYIEQFLESRTAADLGDLAESGLLDAAEKWVAGDPARYAYAAVVDSGGVLRWHTDRRQRGEQLGREWYESMLPDLGVDVVRTRDDQPATARAARAPRRHSVVGRPFSPGLGPATGPPGTLHRRAVARVPGDL